MELKRDVTTALLRALFPGGAIGKGYKVTAAGGFIVDGWRNHGSRTNGAPGKRYTELTGRQGMGAPGWREVGEGYPVTVAIKVNPAGEGNEGWRNALYPFACYADLIVPTEPSDRLIALGNHASDFRKALTVYQQLDPAPWRIVDALLPFALTETSVGANLSDDAPVGYAGFTALDYRRAQAAFHAVMRTVKEGDDLP